MSRRAVFFLSWTILLSGCRSAVPAMQPEEVLRQATVVSQSLTSAAYDADVNVSFSGGAYGSGDAALHIEGLLNDGGSLVSSDVNVTITPHGDTGAVRAIRSVLHIILREGKDFFLHIDSLESDPPDALFNPAVVSGVRGQWWSLTPAQGGETVSVSPSPKLLQMQSSVVSVTRDLGIDEIDGVTVRHYAVALDPDRFAAYVLELAKQNGDSVDEQKVRSDVAKLQATGELWISVQDFTVRALQWDVPSLQMQDGSTLHLTLHARVKDHNAAAAIVMPEQTQPFPFTNVFQEDGSSAIGTPSDVDPDALRSALQTQGANFAYPENP